MLYEEHVNPFLREHEIAIDDFISSAHERAKAAGLVYLKQAIELIKQHVLGLPPTQPSPPSPPATSSYTQSLISRFNLPNARPAFPQTNFGGAASTATDFYSLLASAVTAATSAGATRSTAAEGMKSRDLSNSGTLIPPSIHQEDRMNFIQAQRERLSILLSALDREATNLKAEEAASKGPRSVPSMFFDGSKEDLARPSSAMSGLSKSRSELDFEKIEKDDVHTDTRPRLDSHKSGSWLPWSWSTKSSFSEPKPIKGVRSSSGTGPPEANKGSSSAVDA